MSTLLAVSLKSGSCLKDIIRAKSNKKEKTRTLRAGRSFEKDFDHGSGRRPEEKNTEGAPLAAGPFQRRTIIERETRPLEENELTKII